MGGLRLLCRLEVERDKAAPLQLGEVERRHRGEAYKVCDVLEVLVGDTPPHCALKLVSPQQGVAHTRAGLHRERQCVRVGVGHGLPRLADNKGSVRCGVLRETTRADVRHGWHRHGITQK